MNAFSRSPEIVCCVFGCSSKLCFKTFEKIKLHPFPPEGTKLDDVDLLLKWVNAIKLPTKYSKRMRVCSLHFKDEDFDVKDGRKELKPFAVPSKNLPKVYRNKFYPRGYGKMIKLLEYRGIGKLRLCHEAKLSRKRYSEDNSKHGEEKKTNEKSVEKNHGEEAEDDGTLKVSTTFSLVSSPDDVSSNKNDEDRQKFTSEIMIKEEPLSETEDMEEDGLNEDEKELFANSQTNKADNQQESVEEMLAKMNADDGCETEDLGKKEMKKSINSLNFDFEDTIDSTGTFERCDICGEEDCMGHEQFPEFECVPCGKVFKTPRQLNAHNLSHFEYRTKRLSAEAEARAQGRQAMCKVCHKILSNKVTLSEHMLIHSGEKPHICMLCDKAFRHKANLVQHVNTHTLVHKYKCKVCRQHFISVEELDKHIRRHRIVKNDYTCRECGQSFRSKAACWAHWNSHMRGRSRLGGLACDVCGRVLSTKATLKEHMFIHSGEKPFECLLCGKKIRHRANFIIHVQGHSLGRPHACSSCGLSFARKSELNSHVASDHPDDRPFPCIICGMRFRNESRFLKHAVTHDATLEEP